MFDSLWSCETSIRKAVRDLDPVVLDPAHALELVEVFDRMERMCAAGKAIAAGRVAESGRWQSSGERSPSDWLAKKTGTSVGAARGALDTAKKVQDLPATDAAFRGGELSAPQAEAIADAAAADPDAEQQLLGVAKNQSLKKLRDRCALVKAAADADAEARHREIHRRRFFRTWNDADGARCGMYKMTPDLAAEFERAAKPFADAAFEAARKAGERESSEAYAADGLVAMARAARDGGCDGTDAGRSSVKREVVAIVNLESLQRGTVEPGEVCEIPGVGPVSVSVARELFGDALLRIVIRDGVDIRTVVHAGRLANDAQRLAIEVRQRGCCLRPTCRQRIAQIDHIKGWRVTKCTTLDDLGGLCTFDHLAKTNHGHRYRRGERGWEWVLPDGTVEYERPPP